MNESSECVVDEPGRGKRKKGLIREDNEEVEHKGIIRGMRQECLMR